jgi:hypothetical protein
LTLAEKGLTLKSPKPLPTTREDHAMSTWHLSNPYPKGLKTGDIVEICRDWDEVNRLVEIIAPIKGCLVLGIDINMGHQVSFRSDDVVEVVGFDPYYDSDYYETDQFGNPI